MWLPFLLFVVQEVAQASLGFSSFELPYCHVAITSQGLLDVLSEEWEEMEGGPMPPFAYLTTLCEKMRALAVLARAALIEAQRSQERWYYSKLQILLQGSRYHCPLWKINYRSNSRALK